MDRLVLGPASVSQLTEPLDMTMSAVLQHLAVLEAASLVSSEKIGRVRTYQIAPAGLRRAEGWLHQTRTPWEQRLDRLQGLLGDPPEAPAQPTDPTRPQGTPT